MPRTEQATTAFRPVYLGLLERGELARRVDTAYQHLQDCALCARYCHINLMDQYYPCYRADENLALGRPITLEEYRSAVALAKQYGIERLSERD